MTLTGRGVASAPCVTGFLPWQEVAVLGRRDLCAPRGGRFATLAKRVTLLTNGDPAPEGSSGLGPGHPADSSPGRRIRHFVRSSVRRRSALEVCRLFVALGTAGSGDLARKVGLLTENGRSWWTGPWPPTSPDLCRRGLHRRPPRWRLPWPGRPGGSVGSAVFAEPVSAGGTTPMARTPHRRNVRWMRLSKFAT